MSVRRLNPAVLYVHDLASAVDFYTATPMAAFLKPDTCSSSCAGRVTSLRYPSHSTHPGLSVSTLDNLPVVRIARGIRQYLPAGVRVAVGRAA